MKEIYIILLTNRMQIEMDQDQMMEENTGMDNSMRKRRREKER
jgi:hypothetical protein